MAATFPGRSPALILSEQQILVRDMARKFAQDRLVPGAPQWDREGRVPAEVLDEMGGLGLMGMLAPEDWGGAGADLVSYALVLAEIAGGDGGVSVIMSTNNAPVGTAIDAYGTREQKQRFLGPIARGEMMSAFALTEPQAGSDAANLRTRARKEGNRYVLSGTKQFTTSGSIAGVTLTFAVTDPAAGKRGISAFLVPTDSPGYIVAKVEDKMGLRSSDTCQIVFDDVEVSPDLLLGPEGGGYRIALANLELGRVAIGAQAVGMAQAAYEAAQAYAKEREAFGKPIVEHQAVAFKLADMATQIEVARQMVLHAAVLKDAGRPCVKEASMAKLFASEMAERAASDAIQIHGGYGYLNDFPVEKIYRDVRVTQIYEGTSDIQRLVISREIAAE